MEGQKPPRDSFITIDHMRVFNVHLANKIIKTTFQESKTAQYFQGYLYPSDSLSYDVKATDAEIERTKIWLKNNPSLPYIECKCLIPEFSKWLLKYHACIFHAVSFVYKDHAYLLSAPSGTGKTTQFLNWQTHFPGEIIMISGDMPVLSVEADGKPHVWSSPWNGKEDIGNHLDAPLGGIIYLRQGEGNNIHAAKPREIIIPLINQFVIRPEKEEEIISLTSLLERVLICVPVYEYTNIGDLESTRLLRETIQKISIDQNN